MNLEPWKYDNKGNERPLKEQLERREADLKIIQDHISWYNRNPLHSDLLKQSIANKGREKHLEKVLKDIKKIETKLNQL